MARRKATIHPLPDWFDLRAYDVLLELTNDQLVREASLRFMGKVYQVERGTETEYRITNYEYRITNYVYRIPNNELRITNYEYRITYTE